MAKITDIDLTLREDGGQGGEGGEGDEGDDDGEDEGEGSTRTTADARKLTTVGIVRQARGNLL